MHLGRRFIETLGRWLVKASGFLAGFAIFAMTILITVDVLGRYLFGRPTLVAVEMSGYMLVALIFIGLAYTESRDRHIVLTFVTGRLSPSKRRVLAILNTIGAAAFSGWLAWFTLQPAIQDYQLGTISLTGSRMPIWVPSLFIPIGFAMLTIIFVAKLVTMMRPPLLNGEGEDPGP